MTIWVLLVYTLAVARITGLITADEITRPIREAVFRRLNGERTSHQMIVTLIRCQWCASIYVAAVAAPVAWWHGTNPWVLIPALALAFSFVAGALSDLGRGD